MKPETKNCQNCKKDFVIEQEDFNFYERIKVPPPTWCSQCRTIRRFVCSNS
jgi:tRNA(Ile)-lysidine synthase TilS/MesJ